MQWKAMDERAKIANETLDQSRRPHIKLRAFEGTVGISDSAGDRSGNMNAFREIRIMFDLVNYGGMTAYIVETNITLFTLPNLIARCR